MLQETQDPKRHKLVFTVVKKGAASKVIAAARTAGAEGATTLPGLGTAPPGTYTFWGIDMGPEKEIVIIMARADVAHDVFTAIRRILKLHRPGSGISFTLDLLYLAGCVHMGRKTHILPRKTTTSETMQPTDTYDLIVTIVNDGFSGDVIDASRQAGAEGGTIMHGRGSGIHETGKLFSLNIEPEKEIVFTLVPRTISERVLQTIIEKTQLNEPGKGIAFMIEVEDVAGIAHKLTEE